LSPDQAASIIAAAWRGSRLRRDSTALKQLAAASAQLSAVRQQLSDLHNSNSPTTQQQYIAASESVMKVLFDLDATSCSVQETRMLRKQLTVAANALLDAVQAEHQLFTGSASRASGSVALAAAAASSAAPAGDAGAAAAEPAEAANASAQESSATADEQYHDCESCCSEGSSSDDSETEDPAQWMWMNSMKDVNTGLAAAAAAAGIAAAAAAAGFQIHRQLRQQQRHGRHSHRRTP
jgi:hypothetical protein